MGYLKALWNKFTSLLDSAICRWRFNKAYAYHKLRKQYGRYALKRSVRRTGLPPQWIMAEAEYSTWNPMHQVILHKLANTHYGSEQMVNLLSQRFQCTNERIRQIAIHKCWKYVNGKGCPFKFQKQYNRKVGNK